MINMPLFLMLCRNSMRIIIKYGQAMRGTFSRILFAPNLQKPCGRCAIALYLTMLVIGSIPGARAEIGLFASGVVLHSIAYAILTFLLFVGSGGNRVSRTIKSALTVIAMGAFDEYVQGFFPYRTNSLTDWMVDSVVGIVTSGMLLMFSPPTDRSQVR